jgi:hypothetical protein
MRAVHRHTLGHEHEFEPQYGLPEALPAGERLLWQGAPDWRRIAIDVFHLRALAVYFALLLVLRAGFVVADGGGAMAVLQAWAWPLSLALLALGMLAVVARLTAKNAAYTITDKRVVMRIGIVLTVTYNIPFKRIASAGIVKRGRAGQGDLVLQLVGRDRIPILQLWPHARPWRIARPEPALRGLPEVEAVGRILMQAWQAHGGVVQPVPAQAASTQPAADASRSSGGVVHGGQTLAGRGAAA